MSDKMSISEMRTRRDVLIDARSRAIELGAWARPSLVWLTREINRYQYSISTVAIADGKARAAAERANAEPQTFDAAMQQDRWRDEPSKPAQTVADAMREEAREAEYDKRGPGETW